MIQNKSQQIISEWEIRVREEIPCARKEPHPVLRDHIPLVLDNIAHSFQQEKSIIHGLQRILNTTFSVEDLIHEYAILREVVISNLQLHLSANDNITLNRNFDDAILQATSIYVEEMQKKLQLKDKIEIKKITQLLDQAPIPMAFLRGEEFRFEFANQQYQKYFFETNDFLGETIEELIPEAKEQGFIDLLKRVFQTGERYVGKNACFLFKKKKYYFDFVYEPVIEESGSITGILVTSLDVTDRVEGTYILEQVFEKSPAAMALWKGENLIFDKVNSHFQDLFGGENLTGQGFLEALPEFQGQDFDKLLLKVLKDGRPVIAKEALARHRRSRSGDIEDNYYDFEYHQITDTSGNPIGVYDHAVDVTERVNTKRELRGKVEELEKERSLRESFVAALTHDLRNPLAAAKMGAQLLLRKVPDDLQKLVYKISDGMNRADRMIRDMLDASRINVGESIPLHLKETNLTELCQNVSDDFTVVHGDRIRFDGNSEVICSCDPDVIQRVIENLVNNAVKYGDPHSSVTIKVWKEIPDAHISVHNWGNTLSPEDQTNIFRPYHRLKSEQKGWGIGLTLVQGFIEAHQGSIQIESTQKAGTSFTISLPLRR